MDKLKKLKNEIRYELKENKATFIVDVYPESWTR